MSPYYEHGGIKLYCGDCREILPEIEEHPDTCIVDPVWPNSIFPNVQNPALLFEQACRLIRSERLVVQLWCMSDPRFLSGVPERFKFLRTCWLSYAHPSYVGRVLMGSDVAYAYGPAPSARPGRRVLPGQCMARKNDNKTQHSGRGNGSSDKVDYAKLPHPSPRRLEHVSWLVSVFVEKSVLDPFCGTGTTLLAAKNHGLEAIGIEENEAFCEIAVKRLEQEVFAL